MQCHHGLALLYQRGRAGLRGRLQRESGTHDQGQAGCNETFFHFDFSILKLGMLIAIG